MRRTGQEKAFTGADIFPDMIRSMLVYSVACLNGGLELTSCVGIAGGNGEEET